MTPYKLQGIYSKMKKMSKTSKLGTMLVLAPMLTPAAAVTSVIRQTETTVEKEESALTTQRRSTPTYQATTRTPLNRS